MGASEKIGKVMSEFRKGTLRSSSGEKVTDRKQAVAIALSEEKQARQSRRFTAQDGASAMVRKLGEES